MALLGKIRKKSWLLIIIIGLAMIAFLLDPKTLLNLGKDPNVIGEVNGDKITRQEYLERIEFYRQLSQGIPESYLAFQTWDSILNEKLLNQQAEKVGIQVNDKDFWEAIGKESIYSGIQKFQDKKGVFNRKMFINYLSSLENNVKKNPQIIEERNIWKYQKENIPKKMRGDRYMEMILAYLNTYKTKANPFNNVESLSTKINYIFIPYRKYDSYYSISIKDKEIKKYIESHPALYKRHNSSDLSIVFFSGSPSKKDTKKMEQEMQILAKGLRNAIDDEQFILANSEAPYNLAYYLEKQIPFFLRTFLKSAKIGEIYGPIKDLNSYIVIKLVDKKMLSESTKASHILISYKEALNSKSRRSREEAKKISENILSTINLDPKKFEALVEKSDDPSASSNKGNLGWCRSDDQNFTQEFQNYIVGHLKGSIGIVETSFGYHIIRIDDKSSIKNPAYKLAILVKKLQPSKETENSIYTKATQFMQTISKKSENFFINKARGSGYQTLVLREILPSQPFIEGLKTDSDLDIIHWSFEKDRRKGDTKMFTTSYGDYIIVRFSGLQKEGFATLENVREEIIPILKKKKIAALLSKKIQEINTVTLKDLANILGEKITKNVHVAFSDSEIKGIGPEPKVVGAAIGITLNKQSNPIEGNKGLFIIYALERTRNIKNHDSSKKIDIEKNINPILILESLKNKYKIKDYRQERLILPK